jgi:hypothetical protein
LSRTGRRQVPCVLVMGGETAAGECVDVVEVLQGRPLGEDGEDAAAAADDDGREMDVVWAGMSSGGDADKAEGVLGASYAAQ